MRRSNISLAIIIALVLSLMLPVTASALEPVHKASDEYLSGRYAANLSALSLTGDQRTDVLLVALSQFGYHEGNSDADMDGANTSGSRNFVEYNRIYGKLDNGEGNGTSYGYAWCCAFATWCARQAGVDKSIVPIEVSCQRLIQNHFEPMGIYHTRESGYTPKPADYIFFKSKSSTRVSNHIGIVLYATDTTVYTIEGNSSTNNVAKFSYDINDTYIVGYASPKYAEKPESAISFDPNTLGYPLNERYCVTASSLNIRKQASSDSESLGAISHGNVVSITETSGNWGKISYQGVDGWVSLSYLQYAPSAHLSLTYDTLGGSIVPATPILDENKVTVTDKKPEKAGYTFGGWALSKEAAEAETKVFNGGELTVFPSDTTLYAVWKANAPVTVTLKDGDTTIKTITVKLGQSVTLPALPDKLSENEADYKYEPCGWDADGDGEPEFAKDDLFIPNEDTELTALYTKVHITYTVKFLGLKGELLSSEQLKYGDIPKAPEKVDGYFSEDKTEEYIFDGWDKEIKAVSGEETYTAKVMVIYHEPEPTTTTTTEATTPDPQPTELLASMTTNAQVTDEGGSNTGKTVTTLVIILACAAIVIIALLWLYKMKKAKFD